MIGNVKITAVRPRPCDPHHWAHYGQIARFQVYRCDRCLITTTVKNQRVAAFEERHLIALHKRMPKPSEGVRA